MNAVGFARLMLARLRELDERAVALEAREHERDAIVGLIDDGEFVAVLRLGAGSAKLNKMMIFAPHGKSWAPTMIKGTSKMLGDELAGALNYLWTIPVAAAGYQC